MHGGDANWNRDCPPPEKRQRQASARDEEVYQAGPDVADSLIQQLKPHFTTFGISSELASDGAGEYISSKTQKFLKNWKVNFRLSSVLPPQQPNQTLANGIAGIYYLW